MEQREVDFSRMRGGEQETSKMPGGGQRRQDAGETDFVPSDADFTDVYAVEISATNTALETSRF